MKLSVIITPDIFQDSLYLHTGLYNPLNGFMNQSDYRSVVDNLHLDSGIIWPLPITLPISKEIFSKISTTDKLYLIYNKNNIGYIEISDGFKIDKQNDINKIFKTKDIKHPGVKKELERSEYRVGGRVVIEDKSLLDNILRPEKTKKIFSDRGWKTIMGFQTRNPPHLAHEYLHRVGLELCDGLFINPSIGWKKKGDFTEQAVDIAYKSMLKYFYPSDRVYYEGFRSHFRYAGPKEAIFHAILRKNLGCTHFIIGRDHAGIGDYYGKYEAQKLAEKLNQDNALGIELLLTREPYFCLLCDQIVTEKHCTHSGDDVLQISGTKIREMLEKGNIPSEKYMRPQISKELIKMKGNLFINGQ